MESRNAAFGKDLTMPEVKYFWDEIEDNVVREYDEQNNTIVSYTTEPTRYGSVLSQERSGEKRQYHFDGQGNTTELTDEHGIVRDTMRYSAFGELKERTGVTECPYQWGGKWGYFQEPFAQHTAVRSRQLLRTIGRWLSPDLLGAIDGPNHYLFVRQNPIDFADPSGLVCVPDDKCELVAMIVTPPAATCQLAWYRQRPDVDYILTAGARFSVKLAFNEPCKCCEYRQYVSGTTSIRLFADGKWSGWAPQLSFPEAIEDRVSGRAYGHRGDPPQAHDRYSADGCGYFMEDFPGEQEVDIAFKLTPEVEKVESRMRLRFLLSVVDMCPARRGTVIEQKVYDVACDLTIDRSSIPPKPKA